MAVISEKWKKVPMWARFFLILFGVPAVLATLRVLFERLLPFHRLTADAILLVILIPLLALLMLRKPSRRPSASRNTSEDKREFRRLMAVGFGTFAAICFGGSVFAFYCTASPGSHWLIRASCAIIGVLGLYVTLVLVFLAVSSIIGKRITVFKLPFSK